MTDPFSMNIGAHYASASFPEPIEGVVHGYHRRQIAAHDPLSPLVRN